MHWLGMLYDTNDVNLGMRGRQYVDGRQDKQASF